MQLTVIQRTKQGLNTKQVRLTVGRGNEGDKKSLLAMAKKESLESVRAYCIDRSIDQRNDRRNKR